MKFGLFGRLAFVLAVLLLAGTYLVPALVFFTPPGSAEKPENAFVEEYFPKTRLNLGLDLLGGIHLTLGVEVDRAIETSLTQHGNAITMDARKQNILMTKPRLLPTGSLELTLADATKQDDFEELIAKSYPGLSLSSPAKSGAGYLVYTALYTETEKKAIAEMAVEQAVNTIRNRIDQFGVAEPDIRRQEGNRIVVQLPGMDSTQRAINIIGQTAHLEFRIVRSDVSPTATIAPSGTEFLPFQQGPEGGNARLCVEKDAPLTGEYIDDARAVPNPELPGSYLVTMKFNSQGGKIFANITRENKDRLMAIVLDDKIHSAPRINEPIEGGSAQITGNFTLTEANDLAVVLRAGSLPAPVTVLEERTVGPSLGEESINAGVSAALAGFAVVVIFMAIYYRKSGLIADLMLLLDIVLILAGMAIFGATMTLPGIAGIVLTLGMAIDANVLIFERIREEIKNGIPIREAVTLGFQHAQRAIVDSNLTSIIFTVILYELGSGPVRGFAVTLTLGIIASMFTALVVSRIIFDLWVSDKTRKLSI